MRILLVAATQFEIEPFLKTNNSAEILISGIGIPSTVYHLTKKLSEKKYDLVIQAGLAGTFVKEIKKGDVVAVDADAFADIGVEENGEFKTIFQLGFEDKNTFPFLGGWLLNTSPILKLRQLKGAVAITVNKISSRKKQTKQLNKKFNANIESMEGAAFHYVCLQQNIPFIQIRAVSNKVGERDKTKWKTKEAIENLNIELKKIIDLVK